MIAIEAAVATIPVPCSLDPVLSKTEGVYHEQI
jgi:hypothetical protein